MLELNPGLKNSLVILELLREREAFKDITVDIGVFTNGREVGLTFQVYQKGSDKNVTFCAYQHRNSDDIIINGRENYRGSVGELPYVADDKYTYLACFKYDEHYAAAECLERMLLDVDASGTTARLQEIRK